MHNVFYFLVTCLRQLESRLADWIMTRVRDEVLVCDAVPRSGAAGSVSAPNHCGTRAAIDVAQKLLVASSPKCDASAANVAGNAIVHESYPVDACQQLENRVL